ncbi:hypothetical protein C8Q77DRAFT_1161188 [Trametes polyzona]|nr:hypothetical protein C8Q77DRAFT_1161188 [Trametes polyzona]
MSDPLDIVGFIIGVIGLLAVVCQLLYWTVQNRLPKAKLRVLEETLEETENFLTRCVEEGRLTDERKAVEFRDALDVDASANFAFRFYEREHTPTISGTWPTVCHSTRMTCASK